MKVKTILLGTVVCLLAVTTCYASDPNLGTWKLNEAKSKLTPGMGKNTKVVYAASGDSVKITVEGVDAAGKPTHNEWTGKFDGKDYPVTGDSGSDMRSYKRVNDRTLDFAGKKGGKTVASGRVAVSADGKSRTVTVHGTDGKGKPTSSTAVYDKQ